jgi:hypothetical protein
VVRRAESSRIYFGTQFKACVEFPDLRWSFLLNCDMMLVAGPVYEPIQPRRYRWPLRVHTINAVNRPIKASRIANRRIIVDPPFRSK